MKNRMIVISADAMMREDLELFLTMPNAKRVFAHASRPRRLRSVLPTLTYPCHATLLTGCLPERHGVWMNTVFSPGNPGPEWNWERGQNAVKDDLLFAARRSGRMTASVFWPTTGKHPAVDWLIPEYWPQGAEDSLEAAMRRMGSPPEVLKILRRKSGGVRIDRHPSADFFAAECACEILTAFRPGLLLLHPANIDEARHRYGAKSAEARRAVEETDEILGMLFSAVQETGDAEQTDFVLVSDHGQRDIRRVFCPNVLLRQEGLIRGGPDGRQADWDAYCHTEGMFATVHLKDPGDKALRRRVEALLRGLPEERTGIARVADAAELVPAPARAGFAFALLSDGETAFGGGTTGALLQEDIPGGQRATHGYPPDIGPDPVFLGAGPGFARDAVTEEMNLEDVAPTLAAVLGTKLPEAQGIARRELLA